MFPAPDIERRAVIAGGPPSNLPVLLGSQNGPAGTVSSPDRWPAERILLAHDSHHYTNIQCNVQCNGRKPALLTVAANQEIYFRAHMWRIKGPHWAFTGLYFVRSCPCAVSTNVQWRCTQASIAKEEWNAKFRQWPQTINPQCNRHESCFAIFQSTGSLPPLQTLLLSCSLYFAIADTIATHTDNLWLDAI